jgi:2-polyprenyl-6-methoxyphenol hydroxylase-like FAD-dependent oxidoreductase
MLMEKYKNFHPLIHEIIQNTDETKMIRNDISDLERLNCWHKDSICLLGDAAHATTPNMGQGACQGIEDAYYISRALSSNDNLRAAFLQFEQERRKKVDHVVNNSWRFGQMAHRPFGRRMVKTIMKLSPTSVLQNQLKKVYSVDGLS